MLVYLGSIYVVGMLISLAYPESPFSWRTLKGYLNSSDYKEAVEKKQTSYRATIFFWILAAVIWPIRLLINVLERL